MCNLFIKGFDIFSKPISFTYKKEESYSTVCGGLTSILVGLLIGSFLVSEIYVLLKSPEYNMSVTSEFVQFATNEEPIKLTPV